MAAKGLKKTETFRDDSLDEQEHALLSESVVTRKTKKSRNWLNSKTIFCINSILLLLALAVWSQVAMLIKTKNLECRAAMTTGRGEEEDLAYNTRVVFQPNWAMVTPPTNATNELWDRLSPPGEGMIELPNEVTTGLPASKPSESRPSTHTVYGVSTFHQLHCVNLLRLNMYPDELYWTQPGMTMEQIIKHRDHCIDYLRQAIMCNADVTFEPWTSVGVNGMGAIHQCRDFSKIWTWAYEMRTDKEKDVSNPMGLHGGGA